MENYKEKCEQYLERAKKEIKECGDNQGRINMIKRIFPELKESEDEKIRKAIHIYLDWLDGWNKDYQPKGDYSIKDMIAWLEKQGEQKPAWSEEDESMFLMCSDAIAAACAAAYYTTEEMNKMQNWLKSLKPNHWKPSEEQMKHLKSISVGWHPNLDDCRILSSLYNDLLNL